MFNKKYLSACLVSLSLLSASPIIFAEESSTETPPTPPPPICSESMDEDQCMEALKNTCSGPLASTHVEECNAYEQLINGLEGSNEPDDNGNVNPPSGGGNMMNNISVGAQLMFSPSAFAAQQAMGFIESFFTCKSVMSEEEKSLAFRRGANLCVYAGEYCSKKVKIGFIKLCRTKKKTYCCFNSTLARIINVEGRKQLGTFKGWGSAENPDCEGFTLEEFNKIDMSKMDLSEFVDEITAKVNQTSTRSNNYWDSRNTSRVNDSLSNTTTNASDTLVQDILYSNDPYQALSQQTDGSSRVQKELSQRNPNDAVVHETDKTESIRNPKSIGRTEGATQAEINEGHQKYQEFINDKMGN